MELKKNPKANVGRNSSLYFAVGLNVMLVLTYLGLEHKTYDKSSTKIDILMLTEQLEEEIPITTINIPPPPPPSQAQPGVPNSSMVYSQQNTYPQQTYQQQVPPPPPDELPV